MVANCPQLKKLRVRYVLMAIPRQNRIGLASHVSGRHPFKPFLGQQDLYIADWPARETPNRAADDTLGRVGGQSRPGGRRVVRPIGVRADRAFAKLEPLDRVQSGGRCRPPNATGTPTAVAAQRHLPADVCTDSRHTVVSLYVTVRESIAGASSVFVALSQ